MQVVGSEGIFGLTLLALAQVRLVLGPSRGKSQYQGRTFWFFLQELKIEVQSSNFRSPFISLASMALRLGTTPWFLGLGSTDLRMPWVSKDKMKTNILRKYNAPGEQIQWQNPPNLTFSTFTFQLSLFIFHFSTFTFNLSLFNFHFSSFTLQPSLVNFHL